MLFSLLNHYLDTDTALKVSQSVYCFTTSISHGVENFPGCGVQASLMLFFSICHIVLVSLRQNAIIKDILVCVGFAVHILSVVGILNSIIPV